MIVESIQRVFALTPSYSEQTVYKNTLDPKTLKEYQEIITYRVYNRQGQIEESYEPKVDQRA
jgi:hypothetical protein